MTTIAELMSNMPQTGAVLWIGLRTAKHAPMQEVAQARSEIDHGLTGDRYSREGGKRQVTLIQAEHLAAISSIMRAPVTAERVRRNIVVEGINLLALKGHQFRVGDALLEYTGLCHPCSRMETELGPGGYNAMRGHGGITARVLTGGAIKVGDSVHMR